MANISIHTDQDKSLTTLSVNGAINADEFLSAVLRFYQESPTRNLLWDFREADLSAIRGEDLTRLVIETKPLSHLRPSGKTAIVGTRDLVFGLGRQYSTISELHQHPVTIETFRRYDEAVEWLYSDS